MCGYLQFHLGLNEIIFFSFTVGQCTGQINITRRVKVPVGDESLVKPRQPPSIPPGLKHRAVAFGGGKKVMLPYHPLIKLKLLKKFTMLLYFIIRWTSSMYRIHSQRRF